MLIQAPTHLEQRETRKCRPTFTQIIEFNLAVHDPSGYQKHVSMRYGNNLLVAPNSAKPRLIIICGLPGSGKTALSKLMAAQTPVIRMCPDEWMVALGLNLYDEGMRAKIEEFQWGQTQHLLNSGMSVIIEWGTWGRSERDRLRRGAEACGAKVELHYLSQPLEVLFSRLAARGAEEPPITREDLRDWSDRFQEPTDQEFVLFSPEKR